MTGNACESLIIWRSREACDLLGDENNKEHRSMTVSPDYMYKDVECYGDLYFSILETSSETEVSNMGSPSSLARPRAIFTA